MELVKVASSNLSAIGYDPHLQTMRVLFQEGSTYEYYGVPASLHRSLMKAGSKGQFFKDHVLNRFAYQKVNPREESNQMGKNNQQKAAEARAKAAAQPQPAEQPRVEPKPEQPAAQPSKQEQTIAKLRETWTAKGVDLSKLIEKVDGKFKLLIVAEGWPTVQIGPTGGLTVLELRSYQSAFDAAVDGKELLDKQKARDAKKPASAPAAATPAPTPTPAKPETTTQKKARKNTAIEKQLEAQSA